MQIKLMMMTVVASSEEEMALANVPKLPMPTCKKVAFGTNAKLNFFESFGPSKLRFVLHSAKEIEFFRSCDRAKKANEKGTFEPNAWQNKLLQTCIENQN